MLLTKPLKIMLSPTILLYADVAMPVDASVVDAFDDTMLLTIYIVGKLIQFR